MRPFRIGMLLVLMGIFSVSMYAQSKITFNINLKPQLEDSTFVPGRDNVQLTGSIYPLTSANPTYLIDSEPIDSIYSVTISFPNRVRNQTLTYNFEMLIDYQKRKESLPRNLLISLSEVELDALYFDAFAW